MQLRYERHFLVSTCRRTFTVQNPKRGKRAPSCAYIRNPVADGQAAASEIRSVFNIGASHRSSSHCPKVSRWDFITKVRFNVRGQPPREPRRGMGPRFLMKILLRVLLELSNFGFQESALVPLEFLLRGWEFIFGARIFGIKKAFSGSSRSPECKPFSPGLFPFGHRSVSH